MSVKDSSAGLEMPQIEGTTASLQGWILLSPRLEELTLHPFALGFDVKQWRGG